MHHMVDEICASEGGDYPEDPPVMTTWHADEKLGEAIAFFGMSTAPSEVCKSQWQSNIAIVIDDKCDWEGRIRRGLILPPATFDFDTDELP